jgi:hypothetical protein
LLASRGLATLGTAGRGLAEERDGAGSVGEIEHTSDDLAAVGWVLHLPGAGERVHQQQAAAALRQQVGGGGQVQQVWAGVLDGQVQLGAV